LSIDVDSQTALVVAFELAKSFVIVLVQPLRSVMWESVRCSTVIETETSIDSHEPEIVIVIADSHEPEIAIVTVIADPDEPEIVIVTVIADPHEPEIVIVIAEGVH
jgi:hypothetical protein